MIHWEQTIEIEDGTGRLELRGGGAVDGLYVDGRPVAMHWPDCSGSVGQEYYLVEACSLEERCEALRRLVENGRRRDFALVADRLTPLVAQFPSGRYRLFLEEIERECWLSDYRHLSSEGIRGYYPLGTSYEPMVTFLATQPESALQAARVEHWRTVLARRGRPFAITVREPDAWNEYILDGHHKLAAYLSLRMRPWRLCIEVAPRTPIGRGDWPARGGLRQPRAWDWIFRQR